MEFNSIKQRLLNEWGENERVRYGSFIILLILFFSFLSSLDELTKSRKLRLQADNSMLSDIKTIQPAEYWKSKLEFEKKRNENLRLALWKAESENRVKVKAQSRLLALANGVGMQRAEVNVSEVQQVDGLPNHFQLQLSLEGFYRKAAFLEMLKEMELGEFRFVVETLKIASGPKSDSFSRMELIASIFFQVEGEDDKG